MKKWIKLSLIIIWILIIFLFSNQDGLKSSNTSDGVLIKIVKVFKDDISESEREELISKYTFIIRKGAHFFAYFVLGILIYSLLLEYIKKKYKILLFTVLLCMSFALLDELHQYFIPGRSARIFDVCIDTCGAILGCTIDIFFSFLKNKLIKNK